jgi:hypothetical protein
MLVIAIDPGPVQSGWCVWDGQRVTECGVSLNDDLNAYVWHHHPTQGGPLVAIEMIRSYGMAVGASVFDTCVWVGRFQQTALSTGKPVKLCYRPDVKLWICKSTKAKDANVRQALIDRLGAPGTKKSPGATYGIKSHAWAALAVAVYAHDREESVHAGGDPF